MALANNVTTAATAFQNAAAALDALANGAYSAGAAAAWKTMSEARAALDAAIDAVELEAKQNYAKKVAPAV